MLYTEERAEAMDLSDIYVTDETNVQTFIVPKDKVNDYTQLSDFDGKRIAYQMGTVQQELVNSQLKNPVTSEFSNVQDAVLALQSGKCDAVAIAYQVGLPMTTIVVTHEMAFAREVSSRVLFIHDGVIAEQGTPDEVFGSPKNLQLVDFLGKVL